MSKILLIDRWPLFETRAHKIKLIDRLSDKNELFIIFFNNNFLDILKKIKSTIESGLISKKVSPKDKSNNGWMPLFFKMQEKRIKHYYSDNLFDLKTTKEIEDFEPEYIIPMSSPILPQNFLNLASKKAINFHISLLPNFRGINALEWNLIYEKPIGVTLYEIDGGVDTGTIIDQRILEFEQNKGINFLKNKLLNLGTDMACDYFIDKKDNKLTSIEKPYIINKQFYRMSEDLLNSSRLHKH